MPPPFGKPNLTPMPSTHLENSPLGREVEYIDRYDASLLYPIPRTNSWRERGFSDAPYYGVDIWNAYEISWLTTKGMPRVAMAEFRIPSSSPNLPESKSFKLYLNSFNQTRFENLEQVKEQLIADLTQCVGATISVKLFWLHQVDNQINRINGVCIDDLDIEIENYQPTANLLQQDSESSKSAEIQESLFSHLLKSNCPITGQPDWGSVFIEYSGEAINHESLLRYVVSFRNHGDFHEHCVETIFLDILQTCKPKELTVYARYLRRGGLDINPYRSTLEKTPDNGRLVRQ